MINFNKISRVVLTLCLLACFASVAFAQPNASFTVLGTSPTTQATNGATSGVYPANFWFQDTSTGVNATGFTYSFNFGDGNTSSTTMGGIVNHIYSKPITPLSSTPYNVVETVTEIGNATNTSTKTIPISVLAQNTAPIAGFTLSPSSGNAPLLVSFQNATNPNGTTGITLSWNYNDGSSPDNTVNPSHSFGVGNFNVVLTATGTSDNGSLASGTATRTVTSNGIIADFISNVPNSQTPLTVQFTDNSTAIGMTPTSWSWDFGDGSPVNISQTVVHTYATANTYTVTHSAGVAGTFSNSTSKSVIVTGTNPINNINVLNFTIFPSSTGNAPFLVYFNATASTGSITKLHWDFGDGNTIDSTNKDATVVDYYTISDMYPVTLTATYSDLTTQNITREVNVTNNAITKLVKADFTADPTNGTDPLTVQFTDNSTNVNAWFWNFGDGSSSNVTNPTHIYTTPGVYTASLIVLNGNLITTEPLDLIIDSKQVQITVNEENESNNGSNNGTVPPLQPTNNSSVLHFESNPGALIINDFITTPTSGQVPLCTNSVSYITHLYPIKCWRWDFEPVGCDMFSTHPETALHTFTHVGTFNIRLVVTDCQGNIAIMQKNNYVTVTAPTVAAENVCTSGSKHASSISKGSSKTSCAPAPAKSTCFNIKAKENSKVNIKCAVKTKISSCTVNYGDGKGTHCLESTHTYSKCGTYTVTVTAKNSSGCTVKKVVGKVCVD